jgi:mercuric ion binding protein
MKTFVFVVAMAMTMILGSNTFAQNHDHSKMVTAQNTNAQVTATFKVAGNCDQCKARIEKAAKLNGVTQAEWNKKTKVLSLVFDKSKTTSDAILKSVAAAGHDTELFKADDKAYAALPGCCQYERLKR